MNYKYLYIVLLIIINYGCALKNVALCQAKEKVLIFKVEYVSKNQPDHEPISYALISINKLDSINFKDDGIKNSPNIIYNLIYNGGYYISESFTDIYTYACCELGSVEKGVSENVNNRIPKDRLKEYHRVEEISMNIFLDRKGIRYNFYEKYGNYTITVWQANLKYCVCNLYMETPRQPIYGRKGAYIKSIANVKNPQVLVKNKIEFLLTNLIEMDAKHHKATD